MKKDQKRVFAYGVAKVIDNQDLADVSGGGAAAMTHQQTVRASGASGSGVDVVYDHSVDW